MLTDNIAHSVAFQEPFVLLRYVTKEVQVQSICLIIVAKTKHGSWGLLQLVKPMREKNVCEQWKTGGDFTRSISNIRSTEPVGLSARVTTGPALCQLRRDASEVPLPNLAR